MAATALQEVRALAGHPGRRRVALLSPLTAPPAPPLAQVEAVRQARLAAQEATYQLQQSQGELEVLRQQVAALEAREQQRQCPAPHPQGLRCAGGPGCAAADALQEARLQAADSRYNQQVISMRGGPAACLEHF